jgi:hypothetical protein
LISLTNLGGFLAVFQTHSLDRALAQTHFTGPVAYIVLGAG